MTFVVWNLSFSVHHSPERAENSFHLVTRINPDGTKNFYEHHDLEIAKKTDNYEMDFSKWDGKGEMCFEEDEEGNGFDDDQCVEEPNETKPPKKTSSLRSGDGLFNISRLVLPIVWSL